MMRRQYWLKQSIAALAGIGIAASVALCRGFALSKAAHLNAWALSDGFFVAGFALTALGALLLTATTGFFDIFAYGFSSLLVLFTPFRKPKDQPNYYDYKAIKAERRGKPAAFLVLTGLAFLLIALLCWGLYYRLAPA